MCIDSAKKQEDGGWDGSTSQAPSIAAKTVTCIWATVDKLPLSGFLCMSEEEQACFRNQGASLYAWHNQQCFACIIKSCSASKPWVWAHISLCAGVMQMPKLPIRACRSQLQYTSLAHIVAGCLLTAGDMV